jgi:hypothetical protein
MLSPWTAGLYPFSEESNAYLAAAVRWATERLAALEIDPGSLAELSEEAWTDLAFNLGAALLGYVAEDCRD